MADARYPIVMVNRVPVVVAPAEIDVSNADCLRAVLLEAAARRHATFVVDMTGTQFCASAGFGVLVRAHKRAQAEGGELRLVIPASASVLLVFALTGIDQVIPTFPSLYEAVKPAPATAPRPPRPRRRAKPGMRTRAGRPPPGAAREPAWPDGQSGPVPGSCRGRCHTGPSPAMYRAQPQSGNATIHVGNGELP